MGLTKGVTELILEMIFASGAADITLQKTSNCEFRAEKEEAMTTLDDLFDYLDHLEDRAPLTELTSRLAQLDIDCDDVAEYVRFSERGYMRNLMRAGEWYNVLVLCWKNGQRSPIHDHKGSACGVRVLRGTATETVFEFAPNGHVVATRSLTRRPGSVMGTQDSDLHQVSNLQPGDADLVTMHIYSPPLMWMGTYSLTDTSRGQEPMFIEFSEAAGI
jgi:cysteine dioxygenase